MSSLELLRTKLLVDQQRAWGAAPAGLFAPFLGPANVFSLMNAGQLRLPLGDGDALDIEINVTWAGVAAVPTNFGSVGVSVLGNTELLISSGVHGSYNLNGVALAPEGSARPRPAMLSLRVLVDRSVVEVSYIFTACSLPVLVFIVISLQAFAQQGKATFAKMTFVMSNQTSLVWRPPAGMPLSGAAANPHFSVRVWKMGTGFVGR